MERDANAQSIRELQKQLGEVERVGAVSQLSSMIAHELKQPVASIINFSAALSVRLGGLLKAHPECAAGLCTIRAESERISEIISRVRQYAGVCRAVFLVGCCTQGGACLSKRRRRAYSGGGDRNGKCLGGGR